MTLAVPTVPSHPLHPPPSPPTIPPQFEDRQRSVTVPTLRQTSEEKNLLLIVFLKRVKRESMILLQLIFFLFSVLGQGLSDVDVGKENYKIEKCSHKKYI